MEKEQLEEYIDAVVDHPEVLLSGLNKLWKSPVIRKFLWEKFDELKKAQISDLVDDLLD